MHLMEESSSEGTSRGQKMTSGWPAESWCSRRLAVGHQRCGDKKKRHVCWNRVLRNDLNLFH